MSPYSLTPPKSQKINIGKFLSHLSHPDLLFPSQIHGALEKYSVQADRSHLRKVLPPCDNLCPPVAPCHTLSRPITRKIAKSLPDFLSHCHAVTPRLTLSQACHTLVTPLVTPLVTGSHFIKIVSGKPETCDVHSNLLNKNFLKRYFFVIRNLNLTKLFILGYHLH